MRAWRFVGPNKPMELTEVPDPVPDPGEVVLEVRAAGLCHTDVDVWEGGALLKRIAEVPITLGHEVAGVITAVGPGVTKFGVGDRVAVYGQGHRLAPPGTLSQPRRDGIGQGRDGGFAELATAWEYELVPVPEGLPWDQAAPATDAGMTSYHGIRVSGAGPGTRLGVIGLGGLGFTGARIAKLLGAEVYVAETNPAVREVAADKGFAKVLAGADEFAGLELDAVVDYAGFGVTTAAAIDAVRRGGRIVQVGLGRAEATISTYNLVLKELSLLGSLGGTPEDLAEVLGMLATGDLRLNTEPIAFEDIGEALLRFHRGEVRGTRLVALSAAV